MANEGLKYVKTVAHLGDSQNCPLERNALGA